MKVEPRPGVEAASHRPPGARAMRLTASSLSIARLQKRDLAVIHFSGPNDLLVDLFPKGQATPAEVIACASFRVFGNCRETPQHFAI